MSPVVGTVLLVVITVLLASTLAFAFALDTNDRLAEDVITGDLGGDTLQTDLVVAEDATPGADGVVHSAVVEVDDAAGTTLDSITVEYPKDDVDLSTQSHDEILTIGVDTDEDGDFERTFDEDDVSGVNTNDDDSELTVTFDTATTLSAGERVTVRYDEAVNPDAAGEYAVSVTLNGDQTETGTLVVG